VLVPRGGITVARGRTTGCARERSVGRRARTPPSSRGENGVMAAQGHRGIGVHIAPVDTHAEIPLVAACLAGKNTSGRVSARKSSQAVTSAGAPWKGKYSPAIPVTRARCPSTPSHDAPQMRHAGQRMTRTQKDNGEDERIHKRLHRPLLIFPLRKSPASRPMSEMR
jgi:hypothetical protein